MEINYLLVFHIKRFRKMSFVILVVSFKALFRYHKVKNGKNIMYRRGAPIIALPDFELEMGNNLFSTHVRVRVGRKTY